MDSARHSHQTGAPSMASRAGCYNARCMRSWIFQSNPKKYRIFEAIRQVHKHEYRMVWHTQAQRAPSIHIGDRVYLWASSPKGGLLGTAEVETEPDVMTEPAWEMELWVDSGSKPTSSKQVSLRVKELLAEPI